MVHFVVAKSAGSSTLWTDLKITDLKYLKNNL